MQYLIYNLLLFLGAIFFIPVIAWRMITRREERAGMWQKLGWYPKRFSTKTIWIHAVSVGEVLSAQGVIKELAKRDDTHKLVLSVTTPTGHAIATEKLSELAEILYFPYDFTFSVRKALSAINPALFVAIDTEIWPNVLRTVKDSGGNVAIVNGRISDRSYRGYLRFSWFFKAVLTHIDMFLMQGELDAKRVIEIGADQSRVETVGTLKFDNITKGATDSERAKMRKSLGIGIDEKVILLGNIHEGEEAAIRGAIKAREQIERLRIVIAPRRIENLDWIESAIDNSGLKLIRKTSLVEKRTTMENELLVIDTFGELAMLYGIADAAFVGGSLIARGGQNPLEPAVHGVAPMFGSFMSNFRDASSLLINAGGAFVVVNEDEVYDRICELLKDDDTRRTAGKAACEVMEQNRGVTARVAIKLLSLLDK